MHVREFINSNQDIYKIGRTSQAHTKRADSYPKGSFLLFHTFVKDSCSMERQIIDGFKETYVHRPEFGLEYFEGDFEDMRDSIMSIVKTDKMKYRESQQEKKDAEVSNAKAELKMKETELNIKEAELNIKEVELRVEVSEVKAKAELKVKAKAQLQTEIIPATTCQTCRKTFASNVNLKMHMNRQKPCISPETAALHPKKKYKFKCERCEQLFQTNQNLTVHLAKVIPCVAKESEIELRVLVEQLKKEHEQLQIQISQLK